MPDGHFGWKPPEKAPSHAQIHDGVLNHRVHHRGQLTVYWKMTGAKVPWVYGPSGDEPAGK